jgi:hypothetical protein
MDGTTADGAPLAELADMTDSPWVSIAIVWLVVLILGGVLWQRFTRVPVQPGGLGARGASTATRRVVPLWLALVLLILLIAAVWLTVRWGAPIWSGTS